MDYFIFLKKYITEVLSFFDISEKYLQFRQKNKSIC